MRKRKLTEAQIEAKAELPDDGRLRHRLNLDLTFFALAGSDFPAFSVEKGDRLVINRTDQIIESKLMIYEPGDKKSYHVGFLYDNFGDISAISEAGEQFRYGKKEIKIVGVVVGVLKPFDSSRCSPYENVQPTTGLTAVCDECGKTQTGEKKFLKAEGWELNGKSLCVKCDLGKL
jgi:hypothetical protein